MIKSLSVKAFDSYCVRIPIVKTSKSDLNVGKPRKMENCTEDVKISANYTLVKTTSNGKSVPEGYIPNYWLLNSVTFKWKNITVYGMMKYDIGMYGHSMMFNTYKTNEENYCKPVGISESNYQLHNTIDVTELLMKYVELGDFVG